MSDTLFQDLLVPTLNCNDADQLASLAAIARRQAQLGVQGTKRRLRSEVSAGSRA